MNWVIAMMLCVSVALGAMALLGLLWGIKNRQFEDYSKFLDGTKFDSEEALNEAAAMQNRRKNRDNLAAFADSESANSDFAITSPSQDATSDSAKTGYRPPD